MDKQRQATHFEKEEKEKYIKLSDKATQKLRERYTGELKDKYDRKILWNRILFFIVFPIITFLIIGSIIYSHYTHEEHESLWKSELINLGVHVVAWFILDFFFVEKKLRKKYSERDNGIADEVERKIRQEIRS